MNDMAASASGATPNNFLFPTFTQANVRNYSDMMRSLAAKYNGTEDASVQRREFTSPVQHRNDDTQQCGASGNNKSQTQSQSQQQSIKKEQFPEASTSVNPLSFLSSLPFAAGMLPGIVDMSSTQLLITLSKIAREAELQRLALSLREQDSTTAATTPFPSTSTAAFTSLSPLSSALTSLNLPNPFTNPHLRSAFLQPFNTGSSTSPPQMSSLSTSPRPSVNGHHKDRLSSMSTSNTSNNRSCNQNRHQQNQNIDDTPIDLSALQPPSKRLKVEKEDDEYDDDDLGATAGVDADEDDDDDQNNTDNNNNSEDETNNRLNRRNDFCVDPFTVQPTKVRSLQPPPPTSIITENGAVSAHCATTTTQVFKHEVELSLSPPSSTPPPQPESTYQRSKAEEEIAAWTVNQVCDFVATIDICAEYEQNFKDQCIDGTSLMLLNEAHLTGSLGMKLGPALKLKSMLMKRINENR